MRGATQDAYATLRKRIILGEYAPGERLKEQTLAEELQVSRTPIRLAFRRLEDDGLVIAEPNRGVIVAAWTDHDNDEVFDLRIVVESHAARLAAQRRTPEHVAHLERINSTVRELLERRPHDFLTELQTQNREFHAVILKAAASPRRAAFNAQLWGVERVTGAFFYYSNEELEDSLFDHIAITRAIAQQQVELAGSLVGAHIKRTWDKLRASRHSHTEASAEESPDSSVDSGVLSL